MGDSKAVVNQDQQELYLAEQIEDRVSEVMVSFGRKKN